MDQHRKTACLYSNKFVSKWLVLLIDCLIVFSTLTFTYALRYNFNLSAVNWGEFQAKTPYILVLYLGGFLIFRSYQGIIRHTSLRDALRVSHATVFSFVILFSVTSGIKVRDYYTDEEMLKSIFYLPYHIIIIHYVLTVFGLLGSRILFKLAYFRVLEKTKIKKNVLIFGAGSSGLITKNTLLRDGDLNYRVMGFVDDNTSLRHKTIEGVKVYPSSEALQSVFLKRKNITDVIISVQNIAPIKKNEIVDACLLFNIDVKSVPPVKNWIGGELSTNQIRQVKIEDLLGREEIEITKENIVAEIQDKTVLVTGAAGSIGSEIVRQAIKYNPQTLILLDQSESGLYEIENELNVMNIENVQIIPFIADVSCIKRLHTIFKEWRVDMIFHAAAYKHVPMMERNPYEAIMCNVLGTKLLADLACKYQVQKFVMISTDKAVNPTNVMGASKRIAEMYVQALNSRSQSSNNLQKTKFITTRFGNVLGSNGSVIPLFKKQIERGGPVIVTHPEITRYFMTIPEACQLVLEAGSMGQGGEIFIFDMGQAVKIIDLAKKMIQLSGLTLGKDIEIKFSGLRQGEKLYEELLNDKEKTKPTHHHKIMIANVREVSYLEIKRQIEDLIDDSVHQSKNDFSIVSKMKEIVHEFISNSSIYERLDVVKTAQKD